VLVRSRGEDCIKFLSVDITGNRIYGLDILRAVAILFVVLEHSMYLLHGWSRHLEDIFVFDGVAMFFVLSGFLIGGILIKIIQKENVAFKTLLSFWMRRWLRTLPAYFVVLVLLVVLSLLLRPDFHLSVASRFFFFFQNFCTPRSSFFVEAWSLSVEEWFYLLVPAAIFLLVKIFRFSCDRTIVVTASLIILFTVAFRYVRYSHVLVPDYRTWLLLFSQQVVTRMDGLMIGVLGAYVSRYHKAWGENKILLFLAGIAILLFQKIGETTHLFGFGLYTCVFSFTVVAIGVLLLLPLLSELKTGTGRLYEGLTRISLVSYSMYLLNNTVIRVFLFKLLGLYAFTGTSMMFVRFFLHWVFTMVGAIILYKCVEKPCMDLRTRFEI